MKWTAISSRRVSPATRASVGHISFSFLGAGFCSGLHALLALALLVSTSAAWADISLDGSSSSAAKRNVRSLAWTHVIGSGADAALVVAVSVDDSLPHPADIAGVTFNNVAMHPVLNSHASASGPRVLITQLFYLTGSELPGPGAYQIAVLFNGEVHHAAGGAVSLFGVQSGSPVAVATKTKVPGIGPILNPINAPADCWVVDIVASESEYP